MNKPVTIILIIVGLLAVTCVGGIGLFVFLGASMSPPEGIIVTIDQPDEIYVGDTFDLVITIENVLPKQRKIMDIDFYSPLLDGMNVQNVDPSEKAFDGTFGIDTFTMNQVIPANGEMTITFTLTADMAGVYTADLDIGIDKLLHVATNAHTFVIYEPRN